MACKCSSMLVVANKSVIHMPSLFNRKTAIMNTLTLNRDRSAYLYIGVYSAVMYSVLLIAPVVASMLVADFDLTPSSVGLVFSVELACFSLATLPAYL